MYRLNRLLKEAPDWRELERITTSNPGVLTIAEPSNRDLKGVDILMTGRLLNRRHHLGLLHALFHKDGTFYERLTRFPGGLCDLQGHVRYDSENQFFNDRRIQIGQKVNVPGGIASHPWYKRFDEQ